MNAAKKIECAGQAGGGQTLLSDIGNLGKVKHQKAGFDPFPGPFNFDS